MGRQHNWHRVAKPSGVISNVNSSCQTIQWYNPFDLHVTNRGTSQIPSWIMSVHSHIIKFATSFNQIFKTNGGIKIQSIVLFYYLYSLNASFLWLQLRDFFRNKVRNTFNCKKKKWKINFLFVVVGLKDKNQILTDQSTIWMMLRPYNTENDHVIWFKRSEIYLL